MRFQQRDGAILQTIYGHDGVLARRHIKAIFWPTSSWRAMEKRLSILHQARYLNWPTLEQRKTQPIPETICWLGWRGAQWLSGQGGIDVADPPHENEAQLRQYRQRLARQGFRWARQPRWSQLAHDLAVSDVRLAIEGALREQRDLTLAEWLPESAFRAELDVVDYRYYGSDGAIRRGRKGVRPDAYLLLVDHARRRAGLDHHLRFLLELDNATHTDTRFAREKVAAGAAYVKSGAYRARFGFNGGHWLVVTTSRRRMGHLMRVAARVAGADVALFFFTALEQVLASNVLSAPIWWQVGEDAPGPLLPGA